MVEKSEIEFTDMTEISCNLSEDPATCTIYPDKKGMERDRIPSSFKNIGYLSIYKNDSKNIWVLSEKQDFRHIWEDFNKLEQGKRLICGHKPSQMPGQSNIACVEVEDKHIAIKEGTERIKKILGE